LIAEVEKLLTDEGKAIRDERSRNIVQFAVPESNKLIYLDLLKLIQNKK